MVPPNDELGALYEKAQTLVHYSYFMYAGKFILVDLQGAAYNLYDPEIATLELQSAADQELYFCARNLSKVAFENFKKNHKCGVFCRSMELTELPWKFHNVAVDSVHKFCFAILKFHSSV